MDTKKAPTRASKLRRTKTVAANAISFSQTQDGFLKQVAKAGGAASRSGKHTLQIVRPKAYYACVIESLVTPLEGLAYRKRFGKLEVTVCEPDRIGG